MNIGVLGGTFDPIHVGHLIIAEEARVKLGISEVLFVPAGQPSLKLDRDITPASHRVEMLRRAIASNPYFKLCTLEIESSGPSYTVDTITTLREQLDAEAHFFFILGRDALADLPLWKEPDKLIQMCRLVVAPRLGVKSLDLESLEVSIPGLRDNVIELGTPVIEISASQIRSRVAQGSSLKCMVPNEVEKYIAEQKLYK
jgi:nicotinate-nucleotide adenylyltransferase